MVRKVVVLQHDSLAIVMAVPSDTDPTGWHVVTRVPHKCEDGVTRMLIHCTCPGHREHLRCKHASNLGEAIKMVDQQL